MSIPDDVLGTRVIDSAEGMKQWGQKLGASVRAGDVLVLTGPLGAGKTTVTQGIGAALGVTAPIQSPTFIVARTYATAQAGCELVHVDAYRLSSAAELDELDIDLAHSIVVIEWGKDYASVLSDHWWEITIDRAEPRTVSVVAHSRE